MAESIDLAADASRLAIGNVRDCSSELCRTLAFDTRASWLTRGQCRSGVGRAGRLPVRAVLSRHWWDPFEHATRVAE